jgi:SNF2 family DNA or RNA helicase
MYYKLTDMSTFTEKYAGVVQESNRCFNSQLDIKDHQVNGTKWCVDRESSGETGAFIADEMGLGKTIIMLMTLLMSPKTSTLLIVPASLLYQWVDQIKRITGCDALLYYGQKKKKTTVDMLTSNPIVITTYHSISILKKNKHLPSKNPLHHIQWDRVIYDEAHHLRNRNALWHGATKIKSAFSWLITGTPIQNKLSDFKNMCSVASVSYSGASILRRNKLSVGINLPPPNFHNITVAWSNPEELSLAKQMHLQLREVDNITENIVTMQLCKQACIYPKLLENNQHYIGNNMLAQPREDTLDVAFKQHSKLNSVVNTILHRKRNGNGKLIFCQYRDEMATLKSLLNSKKISVTLIDPTITSKQKLSLLTANYLPENSYINGLPVELTRLINSYLKTDVTILQIRSSCEGLNLQDNYAEVYFVGPAWNPSVEAQAIARCHRIGQKKQVEVFRFYMEKFEQEGFPPQFTTQGEQINYYNLDQYILRKQQYKTGISTNFFESRQITTR